MSQLSFDDRRMLRYAGISAREVAAAEQTSAECVHQTRERLGLDPELGHRANRHAEQARHHAERARTIARTAPPSDDWGIDVALAWGEANYQLGLALLDELMRDNREPRQAE